MAPRRVKGAKALGNRGSTASPADPIGRRPSRRDPAVDARSSRISEGPLGPLSQPFPPVSSRSRTPMATAVQGGSGCAAGARPAPAG